MNIQVKVIALLGALGIVLGLSAGLLYYRGAYNEKRAQNEALSAEVMRLGASLEQQSKIIAERASVETQLVDIRAAFKQMEVELGRNGVKLDRAIQEAKENDQAIRDYLAQPVPDAIGRLFVRPETTDPVLWRAGVLEGGEVRSGSVPTAGSAATSK